MDLYLSVRPTVHPVQRTQEIVPGVLMADFDADGKLIGVELLGAEYVSLSIDGQDKYDSDQERRRG